MKRLSVLLIVLLVALLLIGAAISCAKQEVSTTSTQTTTPAAKAVILRVSIPWPPGDPPQVEIQKMADKFNARTGGRYIMEVHPAEELVKVPESLDAVRTKVVEMAGYPMGVFSSVDPRMAAPEIPFLYNNIKAETAAEASIVPMYNQFLPQKFNQKMLGTFACLPLDVIGNKPVKTLADMKGLMVQAVSPVASSTIAALGANPVPSAFVEGYTVLEKKTVDATMTSCMFSVVFKLYEVAKYATFAYAIPASLGVTINMDVYNSLPKDIQAILDEEGNGLTQSANAFFVGMYDTNNKFLTDHGVQVYTLPTDERAKWRDVVWPAVSQKEIADMGDWGQALMKIANDVNTKYPY